MKADLEIVCGFIEAGKTAFINALNELTKIDDEKALVILTEDGHSKIEANSKEYKMKIASYTEGRGMFVTKFYGYKEASAEFSKARKKTTYDPLNKKEYLLHKLNAIRD